jgi:hypothetical protein
MTGALQLHSIHVEKGKYENKQKSIQYSIQFTNFCDYVVRDVTYLDDGQCGLQPRLFSGLL